MGTGAVLSVRFRAPVRRFERELLKHVKNRDCPTGRVVRAMIEIAAVAATGQSGARIFDLLDHGPC